MADQGADAQTHRAEVGRDMGGIDDQLTLAIQESS
jgi:hypothetical protein